MTEATRGLAGRQFWNELDRDGDDRVSVDDVKAVLRRRKLPESYASDFIKAARGNRWWSNSLRWVARMRADD